MSDLNDEQINDLVHKLNEEKIDFLSKKCLTEFIREIVREEMDNCFNCMNRINEIEDK